MIPDMNRDEYLRFRRPYERALRQLLLEMEFFLEDVQGINTHTVTHRLKSFESAVAKSQKYKLPISDLQDIAGLRIVAATANEVDVIARFFYRKADAKDLTISKDEPIAKDDGYRARHLVVEFDGHYTRSVSHTRVEVQLQTIMQHAYNFISRAWVYKTNRGFSEDWRVEFQQVSADLANLDNRIAKLQTDVLDSSAKSGPNEPLTPFSYQRIVGEIFSEMVTIDDAVDSVRFLVDLGCDTNEKLRTFFSRKDIRELRNRCLKLEGKEGHPLYKLIHEMSLHHFFITFGVRVDAMQRLLQSLTQT